MAIKLILEAEKLSWHPDESITVRLLVLNSNYDSSTIDRRLLVGPNLVFSDQMRGFHPVSVEPALPTEERNLIYLNPFCLYGRQRSFESLPVGQMTFFGYLLKKPTEFLTPEGPTDPEDLLVAARPLILFIQ